MAGESKRVLQLLFKKVNKLPVLLNSRVTKIQNVASTKLNNTFKKINDSTIVQDFHAAALQPSPPLPERIVKYWKWYQQILGLDKVEISKEQVIFIQNNLFECQGKRHNISQQIALINENLKEIYSELIQTKRDNPKYVQLTISENKGLQELSKFSEQLHILEKQEQNYFAQLATSIKEYHDCQNMNTQKYKYLSIIVSLLVSILTFTISTVYNHKRIQNLQNIIQEKDSTLKNELINLISIKRNDKKSDSDVYFKRNNPQSQNLNSNINQITYIVTIGTVIYIISKIFKFN